MEFLATLSDLTAAADLVLARRGEIDGGRYYVLGPVAQSLMPDHPLAATIVLRAMIESVLARGKSVAYHHAARDLADAEQAARDIADWQGMETHEGFVGRLRAEHGRKRSFWPQVEAARDAARRR